MRLKEKYRFRPYSSAFPILFNAERKRLQKALGKYVQIDHIGSTAVQGLGGKGIIDISIIADRKKWQRVLKRLEAIGYSYRKKDREREKERFFFMANLPDQKLGTRLYHIHLSYPGSSEFKKEIFFRDYLRTHSEDVEEYAKIKKLAVKNARKFKTKDEMRDTYSRTKNSFIKHILEKNESS